MSRVLVDTSVWVEVFRGGESEAVRVMEDLLGRGLVCTHGLIRAEILSGARSRADYRRLEDGLSAVTCLEDPPDLWETIAEARYRLARGGFQSSIADLIVAACAAHHRRTLYTLDHAFRDIRKVLPFEILA